jgi:hypothetical protein
MMCVTGHFERLVGAALGRGTAGALAGQQFHAIAAGEVMGSLQPRRAFWLLAVCEGRSR